MFYQSGSYDRGGSKTMCSDGVVCLNEDQSGLCPGSAAAEFMVLAPAAVIKMAITMTVMIITVHHHHQQR